MSVLYTMAQDFDTTMDIENHPELYERNKILGKHPSRDRIRIYFASLGMIHSTIAYLLPEDVAKFFQSMYIYNHAKAVINNEKNGLKTNKNIYIYIEHKWEF